MVKELNKVQMTGRLGADPEMRFTPQGHAVTTFRVASNRTWRSADGETAEEAQWFPVAACNKLAEVCNQYLAKGSRVYVEGRLQTRQWLDQAGQTRASTEVIASDMIMLDSRRETEPRASDSATVPAAAAVPPASAPRSAPANTAPRGRAASV